MWQREGMNAGRVANSWSGRPLAGTRLLVLCVGMLALVAGMIAIPTTATGSPSRGAAAASRTAAAGTALQDAVDSSVAAAAADGIEQSVAVVDRQTGTRVASSGGDEQYISESIVKLFTVAYYSVQAGGQPAQSMSTRLRTMIINSDDQIESALWNVDIVPSMAARYGLEHTSNGPKTGPNDWGWEMITANDEADFLFRMSSDPEVAPLLMDAMANVALTGSDGFDQDFGMNALTGDHGSKQGWTDVGSDGQVQIHSVGWTDRYFVAILQTSSGADYDTLRAASTRTARAVLAAEDSPGAAGGQPETATASAGEPASATDTPDSGPSATSTPALPETVAESAPPSTVDDGSGPGARFLAALGRVGSDIASAVTRLLGMTNG